MAGNATLFGLSYADFAIIIVIFMSVIISLSRGFAREAFSLLTWIVAFWIALTFNKQLAVMLEPYIVTPSLRLIASFTILLIVTLIVGGLFGFLFSRLIVSTGMGGTDRSLGILFGFARGILFVGIGLLLLSLTAFTQDAWWQNSVLIPHFAPLITWLKGFLPEKMSQLSSFVSKVPTSLPSITTDLNGF